MYIAVCVISMLCCIDYGYSAPNDADNVTLVMSNTTCENNNEYGIPFKFKTVSYGEVRDLENQILQLLNERDSVRLADYGLIRHNSLKCLRLTETPENRKRVSEIKKSIELANEGPKLSWETVLKNGSAFIGYMPSMCIYVPLSASDMISCFKEVEDSQCSKDRSTDITLQSSDIYIYMIASEFKQDIKSFHMLCSYFVRSNERVQVIEYSHCDLPNNGALCVKGISKGNNESCGKGFSDTFVMYNIQYLKNACILPKRSGCWYQVCAHEYRNEWGESLWPFVVRSRAVLYTDRKKITVLDVYKRPNNNTKCISLTREKNRLFVKTFACYTVMNFICKKIPYNYADTTLNTIQDGPRDHTLSMALISVGVSIVIILVTVIVIVIARRYFQEDRDTSSFGIQLAVSEVIGHVPDAVSVPGHSVNVDNDAYTGSVSGHTGTFNGDSCIGSVSGRAGTVDNDSYVDSVSGRGGTVDNYLYVRSVPGRAGTVDDDSFAGEVHGRTASGRINLY